MSWLWKGDDGWQAYSTSENKKLEKAFQAKQELCKLNKTYAVNFQVQVQFRLDDEGRQREVKREEIEERNSDGESKNKRKQNAKKKNAKKIALEHEECKRLSARTMRYAFLQWIFGETYAIVEPEALKEKLISMMHPEWREALAQRNEFKKPYFGELVEFLAQQLNDHPGKMYACSSLF